MPVTDGIASRRLRQKRSSSDFFYGEVVLYLQLFSHNLFLLMFSCGMLLLYSQHIYIYVATVHTNVHLHARALAILGLGLGLARMNTHILTVAIAQP